MKQELEGLRKALLKWAKRWNLTPRWCLDGALRELEAHSVTEFFHKRWASAEEEARDYLFSSDIMKKILVDKQLDFFSDSDDLDFYAMYLPGEFPDFEIYKSIYPHIESPYPLRVWLPPLQYRKNYLKAVLTMAVKTYDHAISEHIAPHVDHTIQQLPLLALAPPLLDEDLRKRTINSIVDVAERYCDEVEKYYESLKGWRKGPRMPKLKSHMVWTARVRTRCHSPREAAKAFEEIAEEEGLKPSTIQKAVKEMLYDLGFPLKPTFKPSRGRPIGSKDSPLSRRQLLGTAK